jgi:hypothetical protein
MRFDQGTRTRLLVDMTLDFDPAGSTVEVEVDGTWFAATWLGTATATPASAANPRGKWTQTARTTGYFAGPLHEAPAGATVLAAGRHLTQTRVTSGGDTIVSNSTPINVT